jgi:hypothetical protein
MLINTRDFSDLNSDNRTPPARPALTQRQLDLIRRAVSSNVAGAIATFDQRSVLREICREIDLGVYPPEELLIAFKIGVIEIADGSVGISTAERNDVVAHLVSGFIDELFRSDNVSTQSTPPYLDGRDSSNGHLG